MNIGAKTDDPSMYNYEKMKFEVNPAKLKIAHIKNMILEACKESFEWIDQRGNAGDNIPKVELEKFHSAVLEDNAVKALEYGVSILETKMHPTARDIITNPIKQFVYNVCGKRAYKFEKDE